MHDPVARQGPQVQIETVGAEPPVQVVHHPIIVQGQLQAQRIAQQDSAADLPAAEMAFERASNIMSGDRAHLRGIAEPVKPVSTQ